MTKNARNEDLEIWREWDLTGLSVTRIHMRRVVTIDMWTLGRDLMLELTAPFVFRGRRGGEIPIDPGTDVPAPEILSMLDSYARVFRVSSQSRCELVTEGGTVMSSPHPKVEAWESTASGVLESASLVATIGPGSPFVR